MNADFIARLLEPYEPQVPLDRLVVELNSYYHASEARDYDYRHPELREQLPPLWQEMLNHALAEQGSRTWQILNFGCGTGFEAENVLNRLPLERISRLTCFDPSTEMLERCRVRIAPRFPEAEFIADWKQMEAVDKPWNLLATNSILHHLPDPLDTLKQLTPRLAPGALWLAGHEPSRRFYQNSDCASTYARFLREWRWSRFLQPKKYPQLLRQLVRLASDPEREAAAEAVRKRLFKRRPPRHVIRRLVDLHVANSSEEAISGRGFDCDQLQNGLRGLWSLQWLKAYSFMGPYYEGSLPNHWRRIAEELGMRYPYDGAAFCAVWKRCE